MHLERRRLDMEKSQVHTGTNGDIHNCELGILTNNCLVYCLYLPG